MSALLYIIPVGKLHFALYEVLSYASCPYNVTTLYTNIWTATVYYI
jgi:hypothetical protein